MRNAKLSEYVLIVGISRSRGAHAASTSATTAPSRRKRGRICALIREPSALFGVRDRLLVHHLTERVLQLRLLDEQVVLGQERRLLRHRALVVEREPLLHPLHDLAIREVREQSQIENDSRVVYRVAYEDI